MHISSAPVLIHFDWPHIVAWSMEVNNKGLCGWHRDRFAARCHRNCPFQYPVHCVPVFTMVPLPNAAVAWVGSDGALESLFQSCMVATLAATNGASLVPMSMVTFAVSPLLVASVY